MKEWRIAQFSHSWHECAVSDELDFTGKDVQASRYDGEFFDCHRFGVMFMMPPFRAWLSPFPNAPGASERILPSIGTFALFEIPQLWALMLAK
jgi:hypothetical protein